MLKKVDDIVKRYIEVDAETFERVRAEYFDQDYIIEPAEFLYRFDSKGKRYYIKFEGEDYKIAPSYTAVSRYGMPQGFFLIDFFVRNGWEKAKWISENSANYGTFFHFLCGCIARGQNVVLDDQVLFYGMAMFYNKNGYDFEQGLKWYAEEKRDVKKDLYGFVRFCQDWKVRPFAIEFPLMCPAGNYAGTMDLVCRMTKPQTKTEKKKGIEQEEQIALIDIKSGLKSFYEDNEIQLEAYRQLWDYYYPEYKIQAVYNYGCKDFRIPLSDAVTPYRLTDQTDSKYKYKWLHLLGMFHGDPDNDPVIKSTEFAPVEIGTSTSLDVFHEVDRIQEFTNERQNKKN